MKADKELLGATISELRKKQGLTQKQLGDKLFVSDKTVSKWERGVSAPDLFLLLPLSQALGVSTEELLKGQTGTVGLMEKEKENRKRLWAILYFSAFVLCVAEIMLLVHLGFSFELLCQNVLVIVVLMMVFGAYFCFFALAVLPNYYDSNRIGFYAHKGVRINMPGITFNNSNWFYICRYIKASTLIISVFYPLFALILGLSLWVKFASPLLIVLLAAFVAGMYITAHRHS